MIDDLSRYHRQILLAGFGEAGQRKLAESTAVVIGCGALGTVIADTLARAGVVTPVDRQTRRFTNFNGRCSTTKTRATRRAEAAREAPRINSQVAVTAVVDDACGNVERTAGADVLPDGADNFETYLHNDCAVKHGIP
jgi:adenylyltransferase/sulfurtransferase